MKLLVFADLHIGRVDNPQFPLIQHHVKRLKPDVVLIAGDVSESNHFLPQYDPFQQFDTLGVPVVFCLGNHEFAYSSVDNTLDRYRMMQNEAKNTFCLDVVERFEFKNIVVVGNVLWYDGSLSHTRWNGKILPNWLDSSIYGFDPIQENQRCIRQIEENLKGTEGRTRILLTHCVPDRLLNAFDVTNPDSPYNAYSGCDGLLERINVNYAYCGHTHRPAEATIYGCRASNVGNDYLRLNPRNNSFRFLFEEI